MSSQSLPRPRLCKLENSTDARQTATEEVLAVEQKIKVIGIGGCGSKTVQHMLACSAQRVEYIFANDDVDEQSRCSNHKTILLYRNRQSMKGPVDRCRISAELADSGFRLAIEGADTLFIVIGMGGRTGTQVAPEMARIAKSMGIFTIAAVTMPFEFEIGRKRYADIGLTELHANVDALMMVSNDKLMEILGDNATQNEVFTYGYDLVQIAIEGIIKNTLTQ